MTLFSQIEFVLPDKPRLGRADAAAVEASSKFQEARRAFLASKTAILKFVIPPNLTHTNELFFTGLLKGLLREMEEKPNGLVVFDPLDCGEACRVIRQGIYGVLNYRMIVARPDGFVPVSDAAEAKLMGDVRHDINGVGMVYHGSKLGGPVHPSNVECSVPTIAMIARSSPHA